MTSLKQALLLGHGGIISLVGAGGKTSLMFALARELTHAGMNVLTTTTTQIYTPVKNQSPQIIVSESIDDILCKARSLVQDHPHITAAAGYNPEKSKLVGLPPEAVDVLKESNLFQWIIVEADGAAEKPLKAPAAHEPVVPEGTRTVVAVTGLKAVGKPLTDQWVFRPEVFSRLVGLRIGEPVTEAAVVDALIHKNGVLKAAPLSAVKLAWFNQAEKTDERMRGRTIIDILSSRPKTGLKRAILGTLLDYPQVIDFVDI